MGLFSRLVDALHKTAGLYRIDDRVDSEAVIAVGAAIRAADLSKIKQLGLAEQHLEELVAHSIAECFSRCFPGHAFKVTNSWPQTKVVIHNRRAYVRFRLGIDRDGDNLPAVDVPVNWPPAKVATPNPDLRTAADMITARQAAQRIPQPQVATQSKPPLGASSATRGQSPPNPAGASRSASNPTTQPARTAPKPTIPKTTPKH